MVRLDRSFFFPFDSQSSTTNEGGREIERGGCEKEGAAVLRGWIG